MGHKLDRRIVALEARIAPTQQPITEIYLVAPKGEVPAELLWRANEDGASIDQGFGHG